jgi:hypothetical protein
MQPQTPERQRLWGAMKQMGAKVDAPQPHEDPVGAMRSHLGTSPNDVQRRRDAEYARRVQALQNAWRSPAAAANSVERQRRLVTYEERR